MGASREVNNSSEPSSNAGTGTDLALIHGDQTSRDGIGTAFIWLANELAATRLEYETKWWGAAPSLRSDEQIGCWEVIKVVSHSPEQLRI